MTGLLGAIGLIVTTAGDLIQLISWLAGEGDNYPRPKLLTRVPATTQSAAVKLRERSKAANEFGAGPPT